jgi:hypothetical protein
VQRSAMMSSFFISNFRAGFASRSVFALVALTLSLGFGGAAAGSLAAPSTERFGQDTANTVLTSLGIDPESSDGKRISLKSVDTTGSTWLARMQDHIYDLGTNGAKVNGNPATMVLDLRVQPGGSAAAQSLIQYGAKCNVTVIIKEFK